MQKCENANKQFKNKQRFDLENQLLSYFFQLYATA